MRTTHRPRCGRHNARAQFANAWDMPLGRGCICTAGVGLRG